MYVPQIVIGSGAVKSSVLGMGCWAIGGRDWGIQSDSDSIGALKAAFDLGITHFDTAQAYGKGHSEELIGKALGKVRSNLFIASKMIYRPAEKIEQSVMLSLKRLKTDYIDLFYIHWPKKNTNFTAMMEKLVQLREKGAIRGIGVCNFSVEQMKDIMKAGRIDAYQTCYNLLWRWPERDVIPFCIDNGITFIPYSTIAQGILSGKFTAEIQFEQGDHRKLGVLFDPVVWPDVYKGVEQFKAVTSSLQRPLTDSAIQWTLARPGVSCVLVGARNAEQVKKNVAAINGKISSDILQKLTDLSDEITKKVPDTGNVFRYYP
jgi:aryl-alcohol dehydrogenase-like predicted oxidoreductase